jgi:hypothetical protein
MTDREKEPSHTSFLRRWHRNNKRDSFILRCPACQASEERRACDCADQVLCPLCGKPMRIEAYRNNSPA